MRNERTSAGPAYWAAAVPVNTKMPVPMIAPMPMEIRLKGPSARASVCSPSANASARRSSMDLRANRLTKSYLPRWRAPIRVRRRYRSPLPRRHPLRSAARLSVETRVRVQYSRERSAQGRPDRRGRGTAGQDDPCSGTGQIDGEVERAPGDVTRATRGPGLRLQCSLTRSADSNALGAGAPLHAARLIPTRLEVRHRPGGEGLDRGVVGPHDARVGPHTHVRAVRARAGNRHPVRRRTSPDQTGACERANEDRP